jgi:iron complex transport system substrate-binding protein
MATLAVPNSVTESIAQIRQVAHMIGRDAAGETLVARIQAASRPAPPQRQSALVYQGGGLILGAGTLADDMIARAGFYNAARMYSAKAWDVQPLERIIMRPPDLILAPHAGQGEQARALSAVRRALGGRVRVGDFEPQLLYCGAGAIVRASARLREIATQ